MTVSLGQTTAGSSVQHRNCSGCDSPIHGLARFCPFCGKGLARTDRTSSDRLSEITPDISEPQPKQAPVTPQPEQAPVTPRAAQEAAEPVLLKPAQPAEDTSKNGLASESASDVSQVIEAFTTGSQAQAQDRQEEKPPDNGGVVNGKNLPGRSLRPVGIAAALLIVAGAAFYELRDSGAPLPEERATPETAAEPATTPATPARVEPEQRPPPPPRPAPEREPVRVPDPPRRVVMLDEQRSLQYVRPDLSSNVRVRDFPSTSDGRVLASLAPASEVMVTGRVSGGDWLRISSSGFSEGYISSSMLTRELPVSHPTQINGRVEDMRDTATLIVEGDTVSLFGVAPGTGEPYVTQMQRFIREQGNSVACRHVELGRYRCAVRAGDLGELLLINGAGRAAPDAPQKYFDNERLAQDNRRGLWAQ